MKIKVFFFVVLSLILLACNTTNQVSKAINYGNYDEAIRRTVKKLAVDKNNKNHQELIILLEDAFLKASARDADNIKRWSLEENSTNLENIYNTYLTITNRQELIKPLLPLKIINSGRNAEFKMNDYSAQLLETKNKLVGSLYEDALVKLKSQNKLEIRKAYDDFIFINQLNLNYKEVNRKIQDALLLGTDFVYVYTNNQTQVIIPTRLENDLLDFSTYGLNDKWTVYHNKKIPNINYDFQIEISFREINISPEQVREKEIVQEKQIKEGTKNLLDNKGNSVKDSLGKPVMIDKFKIVKANVYQFQQFKVVNVVAKVDFIDNYSKQLINTFPLVSEFVFEHHYATFQGDRSAIDETHLSYLNNRVVPFPTNEQMVYNSGEDIKNKLKHIIVTNRLRGF